MEGPIRKTVFNRLPAAIKPLDEICQKVYIDLRLRKPEHIIAHELDLSPGETAERINAVTNALAKAGQLDLIRDPKFVSIHTDDPDIPEFQISSYDMDIDEKLILKEFIECLKKRIDDLPRHQLNILQLRYRHHLSAKDIVVFCRKIKTSFVPEKKFDALKDQDIFYAVNKALKDVFVTTKKKCIKDDSFGIDNLKYIFEEIGI